MIPQTDPFSQVDPHYLLKCAFFLLKCGHAAETVDIFSKLLAADVRNRDAIKGLGIALFRLSKYEKARRCFQGMLTLSDTPDAHVWIGTCLKAEGKESEAKTEFDKVPNLDSVLAEESLLPIP